MYKKEITLAIWETNFWLEIRNLLR